MRNMGLAISVIFIMVLIPGCMVGLVYNRKDGKTGNKADTGKTGDKAGR